MDPTWGWFEWGWFLGAWTVPAVIVGRWLVPRLKLRQWWALLVAPVFYLLLFVPMTMLCCKPYFGARAAGLSSECQSRLKQLGTATLMFNQANGERMPRASTWKSDLAPYLGPSADSSAFRCPDSTQGGDYVFNAHLSGVDVSKIEVPSETVLFFEGNGASTSGSEERITSGTRHSGSLWVVTVDGVTHRYRPGGSNKLIWNLPP